MLIFRADEVVGHLFTGRVLFGDSVCGERGAVCMSSFEKAPFNLVLARLSEQVSEFLERDEKIGVTLRRTDLSQPAVRLDEETVLGLHADPAGTARTFGVSPKKVFVRRADPATASPLRVGYDNIAATLGDNVYVRRRGDQVECPCCGRWAPVMTGVTAPRGLVFYVNQHIACCRSMACGALLPVTMRSDRWASIDTSFLLEHSDTEKFFLPREWNKPGPWVTREDLEKQYKGWLKIKKEFV